MGSFSIRAFAVSLSFRTPVIRVSPKYILIFVPPSIGILVGIVLSSVCISAPSFATFTAAGISSSALFPASSDCRVSSGAVLSSPVFSALCSGVCSVLCSGVCSVLCSGVCSVLCSWFCSCAEPEPVCPFPQAANERQKTAVSRIVIIFFFIIFSSPY